MPAIRQSVKAATDSSTAAAPSARTAAVPHHRIARSMPHSHRCVAPSAYPRQPPRRSGRTQSHQRPNAHRGGTADVGWCSTLPGAHRLRRPAHRCHPSSYLWIRSRGADGAAGRPRTGGRRRPPDGPCGRRGANHRPPLRSRHIPSAVRVPSRMRFRPAPPVSPGLERSGATWPALAGRIRSAIRTPCRKR